MNMRQRGKSNHKRQQSKGSGPYEIPDSDLQAIILTGDYKKLNEKAKAFGAYLNEGNKRERLSSSQIRNVLDEIQRMLVFKGNERRLQLLRPKMAYAAGRHKGKVMALQEVTDKAIQMVTSEEQFENFRHFFEAIVAYHRYHGGE